MADQKTTFLESLDPTARDDLLAFICRASSKEPSTKPADATFETNSAGLYMKTIWSLRQQLQSSRREQETTSLSLQQAENERRKASSDLKICREQHRAQIGRLAQQIDRLVSNETQAVSLADSAAQTALSSVKSLNQSKAQEAKLRRLFELEIMKESRQVHDEPKSWQLLATDDLIRCSEPPPDFPTPQPIAFTQAEFKNAQFALKVATGERDALRHHLEQARQSFAHDLAAEQSKRKLQQERLGQMHAHLTGAVRRIQWLLDQRDTLQSDLRRCNKYTVRLENKLLKQHEELQRHQTTNGRTVARRHKDGMMLPTRKDTIRRNSLARSMKVSLANLAASADEFDGIDLSDVQRALEHDRAVLFDTELDSTIGCADLDHGAQPRSAVQGMPEALDTRPIADRTALEREVDTIPAGTSISDCESGS